MIRLSPDDRVLVRMPSWLGDFVMAEPFVRGLLESRAGGEPRLSLVAPAHLLSLLDGSFDGVRRIPIPGPGGGGARESELWRGHDMAVFLDGSMRSVWHACLARIPARVGWARGGRGVLLTHSLRPALERGATPAGLGRVGRWPRYLPRPFGSVCHELASAMGVPMHDVRPRVEPGEAAIESVRERIERSGEDPDGPCLVVNAGARPGSAKGYVPHDWAGVLDRIASERPLPAFVVGGPGEEGCVLATVESVRSARSYAVVDPVPDLRELAAWCATAQLVLTADGGGRQVAAAVGTPRIVVFGPTDPRHTADEWEDERHLRVEVDCGPCHREQCRLEGEARDRCMTSVTPESVARAVLAQL